MRVTLRIAIGFLVTCAAGSVLQGATPRSAADRNSAPDSAAAPHVQSALKAELAGDATERDQQLVDALEVDPNYAPARWQSGQVRIGDDWLSIDEAATRFAEDARLREYRQRRAELVDTAEAQRELARWCTRNRLSDEAAVHWQAVRTFLPADAEAIRALRLKMHNGQLLSPRELAEAKAWEAREREATRKWQSKLIEWREALLKGDPLERQAAIDGLQTIHDPAAISVLERTFVRGDRGPKSQELYAAYIGVLSNMPEDEATQALVRWTLAGDVELAAPALKGRPLASFVPQLIAALPSKVEFTGETSIIVTPLAIIREHEITARIPEEGITQEQVVRHVQLRRLTTNRRTNSEPLARAALRSAADFENQAAEEAERFSENIANQRTLIQQALLTSTNFEKVDTREEWITQFTRALEAYSPARLPAGEPRTTRFVNESVSIPHECFSAGTPVHTLIGPMPIESLKPGDRVLSQDVNTGGLAFQAVRALTLRPAAPLVEIEASGETIRATRGHPFWVNGQGWIMAKHLQAGQRLHTPDGPLTIDRIGEQPAQEAYNLVVSDFATYFVGEHKVLVHDNQPLTGTGMLVPGLAARDIGTQ